MLVPGAVIAGKYRIERLLGAGGMGAVYIAVNERLRKKVALKVLSPDIASLPGAAERFTQEAIAASSARHPGIVEIFDADVHEGLPWIAMEFLEGESLAAYVRRAAPLPVGEALGIAAEALSALATVHRAGIIHRDLKPDNLFLATVADGERRVKVLDFGIAKVTGGGLGKLTKTGSAIGTPDYLAPEQAADAGKVDQRVDVYGMGAILFEMVSGQLPYVADSFGDLVRQMYTGGPRPLRQVAAQVPPAVADLIDRCLSVKADGRPASAEVLLAEVRKLAAGAAATRPADVATHAAAAATLPTPAPAPTAPASTVAHPPAVPTVAYPATPAPVPTVPLPGEPAPTVRADPATAPTATPPSRTVRLDPAALPTPAPASDATKPTPFSTSHEVAPEGGGKRWIAIAGAAVLLPAIALGAWAAFSGPDEEEQLAAVSGSGDGTQPDDVTSPDTDVVRPHLTREEAREQARNAGVAGVLNELIEEGSGETPAPDREERAAPEPPVEEIADPTLLSDIRRLEAAAQRCYRTRLRARPGLSGTIAIDATIAPDGMVSSVTAGENGTGDAELATCVSGVVGAWRFRYRPEGGSERFRIPFRFTPPRPRSETSSIETEHRRIEAYTPRPVAEERRRIEAYTPRPIAEEQRRTRTYDAPAGPRPPASVPPPNPFGP